MYVYTGRNRKNELYILLSVKDATVFHKQDQNIVHMLVDKNKNVADKAIRMPIGPTTNLTMDGENILFAEDNVIHQKCVVSFDVTTTTWTYSDNCGG